MPDPSQGVFETLLVIDGHPVELDAHLNRLWSSLETLFPDRAPPDLSQLEVPSESGRYGSFSDGTSRRRALRIAVAPDGAGRLEAAIEWRRAASEGFVSLHSLSLPGGLGEHKWVDRSRLDEAQARMPAGTIPLVVDADGAALEASRANIFAVRDGALFTPPLDGRILPGITRARVIEIAAAEGIQTEEAELAIDDLLAADEVVLTGSVRGIEPVAYLDGAPLRGGREITDRLTTGLWRSWAGAQTAPLR